MPESSVSERQKGHRLARHGGTIRRYLWAAFPSCCVLPNQTPPVQFPRTPPLPVHEPQGLPNPRATSRCTISDACSDHVQKPKKSHASSIGCNIPYLGALASSQVCLGII
ncbi:hypothetical protein IG631_10475 [Alternaria alternata]|nr:hypothetical protein IG631_10475 [Alternaria alternata]